MNKEVYVSKWFQDYSEESRKSSANVRRLKHEVKIRERICTACTFGSFTLMFLGAGTLEATEAATSPLGIGMMIVGAAFGIVPVIARWIRGE
jgi:hypothetical protein